MAKKLNINEPGNAEAPVLLTKFAQARCSIRQNKASLMGVLF